jgi:carbonic anhydrase
VFCFYRFHFRHFLSVIAFSFPLLHVHLDHFFIMHFLKSVITAASLVAVTHACYDDVFLSRRSANGTKGAHFSYTGLEGPLNWANLEKGNSLCSTGKMQTPINLDSKIKTEPGRNYVMKIPSGKASIENKGHTVEVGGINNGTLAFGGKSYKLAQFHFHAPSEHRINDEYFPLEVHFVHKTESEFFRLVLRARVLTV